MKMVQGRLFYLRSDPSSNGNFDRADAGAQNWRWRSGKIIQKSERGRTDHIKSGDKLSSVIVNEQEEDNRSDLGHGNWQTHILTTCVSIFQPTGQPYVDSHWREVTHMLRMQQIIQSSCKSEDSHAHSQRGEVTQMCWMQQIIQTCLTSEDSLADTQQGKDASLSRLQQIIQSSWRSEDSPAHSQRGEEPQVCTMQQNIQSIHHSKESPADTCQRWYCI